MLVNSIKNISFYFCSTSVRDALFPSRSRPSLSPSGLTSIYAIGFVLYSLVVFAQKSDALMYVTRPAARPRTPFDASSFHSIVICIESCLFGIFVVSVLVDQIQSIVNDRSLIDALKSDDNTRMTSQAKSSRRILFRKVFGSGTALSIVRCRCSHRVLV